MILDEKTIAYFDRLQNIFADMDRKYGSAAQFYGFQCRGCEDNCCRTRFYHHTYLEYFLVRSGFDKLNPPGRSAIRAKAEEVCRQTELADKKGLPLRLMCPLNNDGMCILYQYRPIICRLHGIPHELQKPGQPVIHGPGCGAFDEQCSDKPYFKFDRTQFYFEMAGLENEFKQAAGLAGRIKLTVAEMILEFGSRNEKAEVGGQMPDARSQRTEVGGQKSDARSQRTEVRGQRTEVRGQKSDDRGQVTGV